MNENNTTTTPTKPPGDGNPPPPSQLARWARAFMKFCRAIAIWTGRALFYPIHLLIRLSLHTGRYLLFPLFLGVTMVLADYLYNEMGSWEVIKKIGFNLHLLVATGTTTALIVEVGKTLIGESIGSIFSKIIKKLRKIIKTVAELPVFPPITVGSSWDETTETLGNVKKQFEKLIWSWFSLAFVAIAFAFSSVASAVEYRYIHNSTPPVHQKVASFVFLSNAPMPWIVGNTQSFLSSVVVFPKDAGIDDLLNEEQTDAVRLSKYDREFYAEIYKPLLKDLASCGSLDKKVEIELSGFASSATFSNLEQADKTVCPDAQSGNISERLNLCAAHNRAEFVKGMLEGFVDEETGINDVFEFTVKEWKSLEEMKEETKKRFLGIRKNLYEDGQRDSYDQARGLMNRRVDIAVVEAPHCIVAGNSNLTKVE